ncbi:MAG: hypothetical protein MI725_05600, partial [Pirellulales bacterium]|nr:hypothetical protein [Pirellulales bacterium]
PAGSLRPSHWDFMLEQEGVLCTWELGELPAAWVAQAGSSGPVAAVRLADHRLTYLDYEGPVSNNRGAVSRCDRGTYEVLLQGDGFMEIHLRGKELRGVTRLERQKDTWQLTAKRC